MTMQDHSPFHSFHYTPSPAEYIHTLSAMQRALYVATIVWTEYEQFIKPALDRGKRVIADLYY